MNEYNTPEELAAAEVAKNRRVWDNFILQRRYSEGFAARANRGSYTGQKIHKIVIEEIVGLVDPDVTYAPGTLGYRHKLAGRPVLFSAYPLCGCTQGQHAAREAAGREITCTKCGASTR